MNILGQPARPAPQEELVCHCNSVTTAQIIDAIKRIGADIEAVCGATGAGQVCGGCMAGVGRIIGRDLMREALLVDKIRIDALHWQLTFCLPDARLVQKGGEDILLDVLIGGRGHARSYTVSGMDPDRHEITLTLRREANGIVSRWLCDEATPDHLFQMSEPFSPLEFADRHTPCFLACGIGITPALSYIRANPQTATDLHWWVRSSEAGGLIRLVQTVVSDTTTTLHLYDTAEAATRLLPETAATWMQTHLRPGRDLPHICGPQGFLETCLHGMEHIGLPESQRKVASFIFAPGQGAEGAGAQRHRFDGFRLPDHAVITPSFHLRAAEGMGDKLREASAFLRQFYHEVGAEIPLYDRLKEVTLDLHRTGTYTHTAEELAFGARLAWRNSNRCIGRFFWQTLHVSDQRSLGMGESDSVFAEQIFSALVAHMAYGTNNGDLRPAITIFTPDRDIFISNGQLILYAGYRQDDGTVMGDPKNIALTESALALGWRGAGTPFDVLPLMISIGESGPFWFDLPKEAILEVPLEHPDVATVAELGLKWFALPAVANMALDLGGVVYSAAPSNGFYMGTEIGSFNLADPRRYDQLDAMATALGLQRGKENPLWRDQALVELNRAVLHSFRVNGVRILDHHDLSTWFDRFRETETRHNRPVFGHWPWIVPPMSANLSNVWHDAKLRNLILKPGYFYQRAE